jgi:GWxTD domain-containing protein
MRYIIAIGLVIGLAGCSGGRDVVPECYSTEQFRRSLTPSFFFTIMNVRASGSNRVDIYLRMPYQHLRFVKKDAGFVASYTVTFLIRNSAGEIVRTKDIDRTVVVRSYAESVSERFDLFFQTFPLSADSYTGEVTSMDHLSQLRSRRSLDFTVEEHGGKRSASTILFLDGIHRGNDGMALRPMLPEAFSLLRDSLGQFQEVYGLRSGDSVLVSDEYLMHGQIGGNEDEEPSMTPPYRTTADRCSDPFDSVTFRSDTVLAAVRDGSMQVVRFHPVPGAGGSELRRTIVIRHESGADTLRYNTRIFRRDHRFRSSLTLEELTRGLRFIMRPAEYDSVVAVNGAERMDRIERFWERRGGKARQREFEQRMIEANRSFSTCVNGSETAMGIVYIVCGTPEYIECRGPYTETWIYAIGDRAFPVQFRRDDNGSTEFELPPFSLNEYVWQYFIDRWRRYQ